MADVANSSNFEETETETFKTDAEEPSAATAGSSATDAQNHHSDSTFECNICLDTAREAVISLCGHLFW